MNDYVWKLDVEYPEEAKYASERDRELFGDLDPNWKPEGWDPEHGLLHYGSEEFIWPRVRKVYQSRTSAVRRAQLLESYGAKVRLLRSAPLTFEEREFIRPTRLIDGGAA